MERLLRRAELHILLMLMLTATLTTMSFLPTVSAAMEISEITPSSGTVGTLVEITANISTLGGSYEIRFDEQVIANGSTTTTNVAAKFTVPQAIAGNHTVTIVDLKTNDNATSIFVVTTKYSIGTVATEKAFQEGDQVPLAVNITGGEAGQSYAANITVQTPDNRTYAKILNVVASALGNGTSIANYPTDFSTGATNKFVGSYFVSLNETLADSTFLVGLTNATEYHRHDTVNVKALYDPNESATLKIVGKDIDQAVNLSDPTGLIDFNWTVPSFTTIGSYAVSIISVAGPTYKTPSDVQNFTVPGFMINVTAVNLAKDIVPSVNVQAMEGGTTVDSKTTASTGWVTLKLEVGSYNCTAFFKGIRVNETMVNVSNDTSFELVCNLTDIRLRIVSVINGTQLNMPEVGVFLTPENSSFSTDINGSAIVKSLLPNATYGLNFTRYNSSFNVTTLQNLFVNDTTVAWFELIVECPSSTMQVSVIKANGQPLDNALVRIQETLGAPRLEEKSDVYGRVTFDAPFGRYSVQVYDSNGAKLNETTVDLFGDKNVSIGCTLFDLSVSIKVVDYFNHGIPNLKVKLQRDYLTATEVETGSDGIAAFKEVVGGPLVVIVSRGGSSLPIAAQNVYVDNSQTIDVKIDKYVVLAGTLIETSQLAAVILILVIVVFVLCLELLRRRRSNKKETGNGNTDKES